MKELVGEGEGVVKEVKESDWTLMNVELNI